MYNIVLGISPLGLKGAADSWNWPEDVTECSKVQDSGAVLVPASGNKFYPISISTCFIRFIC